VTNETLHAWLDQLEEETGHLDESSMTEKGIRATLIVMTVNKALVDHYEGLGVPRESLVAIFNLALRAVSEKR